MPFFSVAQNSEDNNGVLKVKATADFTITGDGTSVNWKSTEWNYIPQRSNEALKNAGWYISPESSNIAALQYNTYFKILYSANGIYLLYKCEDSVITATIKADNLNLYDEDVVEAFLMPDENTPHYFEYELSPLNYELPLLVLDNDGKNSGWLPFMYEGKRKVTHAIKINESNAADKRFVWTAEIFIPYNLLYSMKNIPPQKGTKWKANFYRIDYDGSPKYSSWQLTRNSFHDYKKFGTLVFE